jgi:RNase P protein component
MRELYRLHRPEFRECPIDIVVNVRRSAADAPWEVLEQDFLRSVRRGIELVARPQRQEHRVHPGS